MAFDSGELSVDLSQGNSGNRIVPTKRFELFSDLGLFEKLRSMPRVHFVDRVAKFGVIQTSDFGLR